MPISAGLSYSLRVRFLEKMHVAEKRESKVETMGP